ncbi:MAG TPA: methyltransferase domain-containing protein, partial [Chloroflexota bacterium]|nr:methyltransferase domain-containing protein [Chloroflexota bacterium]
MTVAETTRTAQGELGAPAPAAPPAALPRYEAHEVRRLARGVLDAMAITDLVYHDLAYAEPLVVDLLYEVLNRTPTGGRVLAIGPNAYLARVLAEQGFDLEIWRFGENLLLQEVLPAGQGLAGEVTPQQLAGGALPFAGTYDTIVLPLVLEHVQANPRLVLEALRPLLAPGGCIVLATANLG